VGQGKTADGGVVQLRLALLGRDLLQHFTLFYNGGTGQITLAI